MSSLKRDDGGDQLPVSLASRWMRVLNFGVDSYQWDLCLHACEKISGPKLKSIDDFNFLFCGEG